jgi:hypothetical protein
LRHRHARKKVLRGQSIALAATLAVALIAIPLSTPSEAFASLGPWTVGPTPSPTGSWYAVDFAGGKWIALGHTSDVAVSSNGTTWSEHPVPAGSWQAVTYGNGLYVAVSSVGSGPHEMVSSNGVDWSTVAGPSGQMTGLTFGNGHFVGVGSQGQIVTSSNGTTWSTTFSRKADDFTGVTYGNGRFVAVDAAQGDTLLSYDGGIRWAFYKTPLAGLTWGAVTFGSGIFVAFDNSGAGYVATSDLGAVWVLHQYSPAQLVDGATYGCGSFVADAATSSSSSTDFLSSTTAASWSAVSVPTDSSSDWTSVAFGGHRFVAVDSTGTIASATVSANCAAAVPTTPQQVSGNVHSGEIWTYMHPSASSGGAPINGYRVIVTDGVTTKTCLAAVYFEPNCIIKGLKNHDVYMVTTEAHNKFGYSLPTDPELAIPVASAAFNATTTPVVSGMATVHVQVTGIAANGEGIYPVTTVTVHFGSQVAYCRPNPFGECVIGFPNPHVGPTAISASYSGYGRGYRSPTNHVTVAVDALSSTSVTAGTTFTVSVHGGLVGSLALVNFAAKSFVTHLNRVGAGTITVTAPKTSGVYAVTISDAGIGLQKVSVAVHA